MTVQILQDISAQVFTGDTFTALGRPEDINGNPLLLDNVESIALWVYPLPNGANQPVTVGPAILGYNGVSITPSAAMFSELQTGGAWTLDDVGYGFAYQVIRPDAGTWTANTNYTLGACILVNGEYWMDTTAGLSSANVEGTVSAGVTGVWGTDAIQTLDFTGTAGQSPILNLFGNPNVNGGTFTLTITVNGAEYTTAAIAYNAAVADVQSAINTALGTAATNGTATGSDLPSGTIQWTCDPVNLNGFTPNSANLQNNTGEQLNTQVAAEGFATTTGTFTITCEQITTGAITFSPSAGTLVNNIQAALNAAGIYADVGGSGITGITLDFSLDRGPWYSMPISAVTVAVASGTVTCSINATTQVGAAGTNASQNIAFTGNTGSFTLTCEGTTTAEITFSTDVTTLLANINATLTAANIGATAAGTSLSDIVVTFNSGTWRSRPVGAVSCTAASFTAPTFPAPDVGQTFPEGTVVWTDMGVQCPPFSTAGYYQVRFEIQPTSGGVVVGRFLVQAI